MQDLSKYSLAQLRALEVQVIEELKTRHYLSVSKAREQILYIAQTAGVSVEKLMASKGPRASKADKADKASKADKTPKDAGAAPKYRNPDDPAQQWGGRGRQPAWVKTWIASGKSMDDAKA
jgi:DNA-binding protein H-NS